MDPSIAVSGDLSSDGEPASESTSTGMATSSTVTVPLLLDCLQASQKLELSCK